MFTCVCMCVSTNYLITLSSCNNTGSLSGFESRPGLPDVCVCVYVWTHASAHKCMCVLILNHDQCMCILVLNHVQGYLMCVCACVRVCTDMYICMYACMDSCLWMCVYVNPYTTQTRNNIQTSQTQKRDLPMDVCICDAYLESQPGLPYVCVCM
jgi:hypothetical protein